MRLGIPSLLSFVRMEIPLWRVKRCQDGTRIPVNLLDTNASSERRKFRVPDASILVNLTEKILAVNELKAAAPQVLK
jgi:hypothetical protein